MSEFSFSPITTTNSKKTNNLSRLVMSDLFLFCFFILSHPLYFSYFVFFSPYIIKILSFLSPLFIPTSLLLLALFTTLFSANSSVQFSGKSKVSFLLTAYQIVLDKLRSDADEQNPEFQHFEEFEGYKIVFDSSITIETLEVGCTEQSESPPVDKHLCHESFSTNAAASQEVSSHVNEIKGSAEIMLDETESIHLLIAGGKNLGGFLEEEEDDDYNDFVDVSCERGPEKEVKLLSVEFNKVDDQEQKAEELSMKSRSKGATAKLSLENEYSSVRVNSHRLGVDNDGDNSQTMVGSNNLGGFGSMRREKEWRRTLACKLFEERHNRNIEGSEGMDLLWETYETTHSSKQRPVTKNKTKKGKKVSKCENDVDEEKEEEEEEMDDGQLCCLQALNFSAGKMNLGMGRPNLMKISKAFKGIGWLHNVTKHGKKMFH